jgi:hypothetical protein
VQIQHNNKQIGLCDDLVLSLTDECIFFGHVGHISGLNLPERFDIVTERRIPFTLMQQILSKFKFIREETITTVFKSCRINNFKQYYVDHEGTSVYVDAVLHIKNIQITSSVKAP